MNRIPDDVNDTTQPDWTCWERRFSDFLARQVEPSDPAHDDAHIRRVVQNARVLAEAEGARLEVVLPAAWLHDCVAVPKDSPRRGLASRAAAEAAAAFLDEAGYPGVWIPGIRHAIEAHSFSARIPAETLEAKVVQDADRLDALGAVGIARCLMLGGTMARPLYDPADPFARRRAPDDGVSVVDHFFTKLLRLEGTMQTRHGRREAQRRTAFIRAYLHQLGIEIGEVLPETAFDRTTGPSRV